MMTLLSDTFGLAQVTTVLALFVKNAILPSKIRDNRMVSTFGIWLGGSMVRSFLTKTGAFEVYLGQKLVYSAIAKEGKTPTMEDLVSGFKKVGVTIKP